MKRPCRECKSAGTSRGVLGTCRGTVQNYVFRPNEATEASLFVHRCMDSCPAHKGGRRGRNGPKTGFFEKNAKKVRQLFGHLVRRSYFCTRNSGCSSARLEYASGGRVVAGSNPVTPTELPSSNDSILIESLLLFLCLHFPVRTIFLPLCALGGRKSAARLPALRSSKPTVTRHRRKRIRMTPTP